MTLVISHGLSSAPFGIFLVPPGVSISTPCTCDRYKIGRRFVSRRTRLPSERPMLERRRTRHIRLREHALKVRLPNSEVLACHRGKTENR